MSMTMSDTVALSLFVFFSLFFAFLFYSSSCFRHQDPMVSFARPLTEGPILTILIAYKTHTFSPNKPPQNTKKTCRCYLSGLLARN